MHQPMNIVAIHFTSKESTTSVVSSHVIRDIFRTHFKFTYVIRIIRVQKNSVVENGVAYS